MRTGVLFIAACLAAGDASAADTWAGAWVGSAHGPYPAGNAVAQPDLQLVFPDREANDQTFRLIVNRTCGEEARGCGSRTFSDRSL
jgi:hypothetical protein